MRARDIWGLCSGKGGGGVGGGDVMSGNWRRSVDEYVVLEQE